jgi:hypothetical protein
MLASHAVRRSAIVAGVMACWVVANPLLGQPPSLSVTPDLVAPPAVSRSLGYLVDAAENNQHLYVISRRVPGVAVLSPMLRLLRQVGARGRSIGQYVEAKAVRIAPDNRVLVLDTYLRRIYAYAVRRDSLDLEYTIPLPGEMNDFVPNGDGSVWAIGPYGGKRLHRIRADGRVVESYWALDTGRSAELQHLLAKAYVLSPQFDGLLAASIWFPQTEWIRPPASAPRKVPLVGFRPVVARDIPGGYAISSGPAGATYPIRPVRLSDNSVLLQAAVLNRTDGGDVRTLQWVQSAQDRAWHGPARAPYRLLGLSGDRALVQHHDSDGTIGLVRLGSPNVGARHN